MHLIWSASVLLFQFTSPLLSHLLFLLLRILLGVLLLLARLFLFLLLSCGLLGSVLLLLLISLLLLGILLRLLLLPGLLARVRLRRMLTTTRSRRLSSHLLVVRLMLLQNLLPQLLLSFVDIRIELVAILSDWEFLVVINRNEDLFLAFGFILGVVELGHIWMLQGLLCSKPLTRIELEQIL